MTRFVQAGTAGQTVWAISRLDGLIEIETSRKRREERKLDVIPFWADMRRVSTPQGPLCLSQAVAPAGVLVRPSKEMILTMLESRAAANTNLQWRNRVFEVLRIYGQEQAWTKQSNDCPQTHTSVLRCIVKGMCGFH